MPKNTQKQYRYTQNRELSWLRFNQRVLEEAADPTVPALERLKFVSIFSSNLDEFFMVRVGSLFDLARMMPDDADSKTGWAPAEQLHHIYRAIPGLLTIKAQIYAAVMEELGRGGIQDVSPESVTMLLEQMDRQIALGKNGYICVKANAVTERSSISWQQPPVPEWRCSSSSGESAAFCPGFPVTRKTSMSPAWSGAS